MVLSSLNVLNHARVRGFTADCPPQVHQRLSSLGFTPNTEVLKLRRAPLGDPCVYELMGYQICLRNREASFIECVPVK